MKKLIISIIFALWFGMSLNAQNDGFFTSNFSEYREETAWDVEQMPLLPGSHGSLGDYDCVNQQAPIGSGLLILTALALLKLKNEK